MSAAARTTYRRGACPGLSAPMLTGDGLLARLLPIGTIGLDQMAGLCMAARLHGNGILEITSRGSIQVRGLRDASALAFADAVAQLGIAADDGVRVTSDPLAGLDPDELIDAGALAAELRRAIAANRLGERLAPKVSVAIDGGGALHVDALAADIRLRAIASPDGPRLHVAIGGDAAHAIPLRATTLTEAIDTTMRLLGAIAAHGRDARARDVISPEDFAALPPRAAADPIGAHRLRGDTLAVGIGFAFGHTGAAALDALIRAARDVGAAGLRTGPGRALLMLGITADRTASLVRVARDLSFIVARDDPRRRVVACAGAPVCTSGEIAARALAPRVAQAAAPFLAGGEIIHVSGCAKGCAHHGAAALTVVGRDRACDLMVGEALTQTCASADLPQALARLARARHEGTRRG